MCRFLFFTLENFEVDHLKMDKTLKQQWQMNMVAFIQSESTILDQIIDGKRNSLWLQLLNVCNVYCLFQSNVWHGMLIFFYNKIYICKHWINSIDIGVVQIAKKTWIPIKMIKFICNLHADAIIFSDIFRFKACSFELNFLKSSLEQWFEHFLRFVPPYCAYIELHFRSKWPNIAYSSAKRFRGQQAHTWR